jgi:hypothetical protein
VSDRVGWLRHISLRALLRAAPLIFIVHFLEEGSRFVHWFNAHVARGISESLFWSVNFTALGITLGVVAAEEVSQSRASAMLVVGWLSLLMCANALFHVAGATMDRAYMPGVVTAVLLYLPYYTVVIWRVRSLGRMSPTAIGACAVVGALPMLVHGYLIVFRGTRLF